MPSGKELKAIISIAGTIDPSLGDSIAKATKTTSGLGAALKVTGAVAATGLAALGTAAVAGTKALVDLGTSFDSASDAIRIGTGATGEALEALQADFDEVYKSVPTTMEDASQAIADYNTRLGLTGPELQNISEQAIQVSNMLGDDLGSVIEESSQAFEQWNINAEDMTDAMDYVFKASQSTGTGFTELLSTVQQFGPQLQDMGFSFEEATALIGQLDKAGVNTNEVLAAMKKSVTTMAKDGISATEGLAQYAEAIKAAGTEAEATAIAAEVFGSRAGSTMAAAIREGTLSVDDLTASLMASDETILKAAEDTMDFPEKLQLLKQNAQVAFEPLANQLFNIINDVMPLLGDAMNDVVPMITDGIGEIMPIVTDMAGSVFPMIQNGIQSILPFIQQVIGYATQNLPRMMSLIGQVAAAVTKIATPLATSLMPIITNIMDVSMTFIESLISSLLPPVTDIISTIVGLLPTILDALQPIIDAVIEIAPLVASTAGEILSALAPVIAFLAGELSTAIQSITPVVVELISTITPLLSEIISSILPPLTSLIGALMPVIQAIFDVLQPIISIIMQIVQAVLPLVIDQINQVMAVLEPAIAFVSTVLTAAIENLLPIFESVITPIFDMLNNLIDFVVNVFTGKWSAAWENVKNVFKNAFEALAGFIKAPMNAVIAVINGAIEAINSLSIEIPHWVPIYGGQTFGLSIAQLPYLARGGFTNGVSIAGEAGTEAVISFDPSVRQQNLSYWAKAGKLLGVNANAVDTVASSAKSGAPGGGGNQITFSPNVTIQGNADYDTVMQALRDNEEEFMDMVQEFLARKEAVAYG